MAKVAEHVRAAISSAMQPKMATTASAGRQMAAHVQAAITAAAQPKMAAQASGTRPRAAHVQAAIAAAAQPKMTAQKSRHRSVAGHVQAAVTLAVQPRTVTRDDGRQPTAPDLQSTIPKAAQPKPAVERHAIRVPQPPQMPKPPQMPQPPQPSGREPHGRRGSDPSVKSPAAGTGTVFKSPSVKVGVKLLAKPAVQRAKKKTPSARTKMIPIYSLNKSEPEFDQLYKMLDTTEIEYYDELADRMHQAIHINSDLMNPFSTDRFPQDIQQEYWDTLERFRGLHVGSVSTLEQGWSNLLSGYSGSKTGGGLYSALRSPGFKNVLDTSDVDFKDDDFARKYPEVHHLLYKAIYPEYAAKPWNLMVSTRGSSKKVGQHEGIFHNLSAAKMGGIYTTLVPAADRLIRSWTGQDKTFYPSYVETPFFDYNLPIVKAWSSVHIKRPTFLSSPLRVNLKGFTCGAKTSRGGRCKRRVKRSGQRCFWHS